LPPELETFLISRSLVSRTCKEKIQVNWQKCSFTISIKKLEVESIKAATKLHLENTRCVHEIKQNQVAGKFKD